MSDSSSNLFNNINIAVIKIYENNNPYNIPNNLSKIIPSIYLSKSELIIFLNLFKINRETKNIIGTETIIPKILI